MFRKIAVNAGWLGLIQLVAYAIPLLTLPVIARAFGSETFGMLAVATAQASYVGLLVTYGFNFTGPRLVAPLRRELLAVSQSISAIVGAQLLLASLGGLIFITIVSLTSLTWEYKLISVIILMQVIATSITPQWIFIGLERVRDFAFIQMVCRLAAAIVIVMKIRNTNDLEFYVIINCIAAALVALFSFSVLHIYGLRWRLPSRRAVLLTLREASGLFVSTVSINLYTTTNVIIVNWVLGPAAAGAFALADRVCSGVSGILGPITNAIYPFACRIAANGETVEEASVKRMFFQLLVVGSAIISTALFWFAPVIIHLIAGSDFERSIPILRVMAYVPLVVTLSNLFAVQTLIPLKMDRAVAKVVISAAVLGIILMAFSSSIGGLVGAGLSVLLIEIYVTFAFAIVLSRETSIRALFC